jgi:hypothetical protein
LAEAHVLRLALDGHLTLSLLFMHPNQALCGTIITVDDTSECFDPGSISDHDEREDRVEKAKRVLIDARHSQVLDIEGEYHIEGVWDLLMRGGERYYVEDKYQTLTDGPGVYPFYLDQGIYVVKEPVGTCRLRPELPDGGIPNDSFLVVRTAALQELEARIAEKSEKKPLGKRERDTLLIIIAALARMAQIDLKKPSKAAANIEGETERMGARVSERTILDHLHRIPEALEDRGDDRAED